MQPLLECRVRRPADAAEAVALLAAEPNARLVAGGTDLLPNVRRGLANPPVLVDLSTCSGFANIEPGSDGSIALGAGVTLATITRDPLVAARLPALAEAARLVAGPGHRSAATLAGNLCQDTRCIFYNQSLWWRATNRFCLKRDGDTCHVAPLGSRCHAAFCSDLAPVLLVLGAQVELQSARGTRALPLQELYRDDGADHLTLASDEMLVRVRVPAPPPGLASGYRKARVRGAMDFPLAGVAVALALADGRIASLRIGVSGTNSYPLLLAGTDAWVGQQVDDALLSRLNKLVQQQVKPMRSTVTSANYRRQVASVLARRLLRELAAA